MGRPHERAHGWATMRERLAGQLWVWPTVFVLVVFGLAWTLAVVDDALREVSWIRFPGGSESAQNLLSTIAGAMITFTGLVFSVTVLVLQLASQQFSPRIMRTFLRDRVTQFALAMFTATFTYALIVLRQVRSADVPSLSVTFAVLLVLASVGTLVAYISHMANAIRVTSIMARVADEAREVVDRLFDGDAGSGSDDDAESKEWLAAPPDAVVRGGRPGVLEAVDIAAAVDAARSMNATLVVHPRVGDFVPAGADVMGVHAAVSTSDTARLDELFTISNERSLRQDPAFALRQLADIAERALSPTMNDVTTAIQAIDQTHDLLRRIATRRTPASVHRDERGVARLVMRPVQWDSLVTLAVTEIRWYGRTSVQVHRRLRSMLRDLLDVAPEARRRILREELRALDDATSAFDQRRDRALARTPDAQGLGG